MTKHSTLASLLMIGLMTAAALVGLLTSAAPAYAAIPGGGGGCQSYSCGGSTFTAIDWGKGSTCAQAHSNCTLAVYGDGYDNCEAYFLSSGRACDFGNISYSNCYVGGDGQLTVDCTVQHRCEICDEL